MSSQWYHWECLFGGHRRPRGDKAVAFRAVGLHRIVRDIAFVENLGPRREFEADAVGVEEIDRRSEEHTSELQSLMRISYAVFCLKKKKKQYKHITEDISDQTTQQQFTINEC